MRNARDRFVEASLLSQAHGYPRDGPVCAQSPRTLPRSEAEMLFPAQVYVTFKNGAAMGVVAAPVVADNAAMLCEKS